MFYVYILKSAKHSRLYRGRTDHLRKRLRDHHAGKVFTTKNWRPLTLVYYEAYRSREDSIQRERALKKSGSAWMGLKKRILKSIEEYMGVADGGVVSVASTVVSKTTRLGSSPSTPANSS